VHATPARSGLTASTTGAASAAAVLAGLSGDQCRWALSYTAQQASGIACWARDEEHVEKAFDFGGMGARNGVAAATMVQAGFSGVEDVFSGPRSFFEAFGGDANGLVRELGSRTQRFCELQDALGGANSATLSQRLKLLEDEGLVDRRLVSETPPWVEYSLTDKGADLRRAINGIDRWADRWASQQ